MKVEIYNKKGKKTGTTELYQLSKKDYRKATSEILRKLNLARYRPVVTKTRKERRGGGRKPWRQKGTGRARAGSVRSPLWRKGGVIHGPKKEKNYYKKVNKKAQNFSRNWLLTEKNKEKELLVWDIEKKDLPKKTKEFESMILSLPLKEGSILLLHDFKENILSARNIPYLTSKRVNKLSALDLIINKTIIITKKAFAEINKKDKPK